MRYSIEQRDKVYIEGHGFLSLNKNLSNKYSQKRIDTAKKVYNRCIKNSIKNSNSKNNRSNW